MKKINLKSILKKTFKKKNTKNKIAKKKVKVKLKKHIARNVGRPSKLKKEITKKIDKNKLNKNLNKTDNLKLTKTLDQKPEIVKIKKQGIEKREYKPKDHVVYPKHGVGQIMSVSSKKIGGIDVQCYDIKFEKDKAVGLLPINKQYHLRPLSTINQVNKSISILKGKPKIKRSMWSRRAQEYEQKITSGKIYELAEVVRDLNKGDDIMIDQSYSERQLFEKAYERIASEFQIVLNLDLENTQKKLDKALKRNLEKSEAAVPKINKDKEPKDNNQDNIEENNNNIDQENGEN